MCPLQRVMALAQQNNTSPDKMLKTLQERNAIPEIAQEIATAKVMDLIEVNAHVEEVPVTRP